MEKGTLIFAFIALGEFIFMIFYYLRYHLPLKRKTEEKIREKMDDPRLTKLTTEEKDRFGSLIKRTLQFGEDSEKVRKEMEEKLEAKIKEIGRLGRNLEEVWELLKKSDKEWRVAIDLVKKSSDMSNESIRMANELGKLAKENREGWEETWNLYLETKDKHERSNKEMVYLKSMGRWHVKNVE